MFFEARVIKKRRKQFEQSANFKNGKFTYPIETKKDLSFKNIKSVLVEGMKGNPNKRPAHKLRIKRITREMLATQSDKATVTWFGHSSASIQLDGKLLLLDPMLELYYSPVKSGGKRYSIDLPIELEELPTIDAMFISHNHYDHLNKQSIVQLKHKVKKYFVPLGVGYYLERWGVAAEKIVELDWWQEIDYLGLTIICTPARHSSGRGILDQDATLWCSWVVKGNETNIFYSGDSGYGPHFKQIGEKFGPFHLAMMECGQYDDLGRWILHMIPEETVQAFLDVDGEILLPVHWGAFTLALHDWDDPIERIVKLCEEKSISLATPYIGEMMEIRSANLPQHSWWRVNERK